MIDIQNNNVLNFLIFKFRLLLNTKVTSLTRLFARSEFDIKLLVIVNVIYLGTTGPF